MTKLNRFTELYVIGDKINDGTFGSVWRINIDQLKCVKVIETRKKAAISEYELTQKAFSDECIGVELFVDDIYNNKIMAPQAYLMEDLNLMKWMHVKDKWMLIYI